MFTYTKRADGRLMKRVSVNGKLKTIYANNPKDLEKQYVELKYLSGKGIIAEDNGITVEQWATKWLNVYKSDKQHATKNMYSDAIRLYINPELGLIKLKNLKENDIQNLLTKLNEKPRQKEIVLLTVKQILDKAVDNDFIYKNVAKSIKLKKHKAKEKKPLQAFEIEYLKKAFEKDENCFMILFMLYTGVRREEVAPLRYKDIDLENRKIQINKAVYWANNKPFVKTTKNEDSREIPILDIIYNKLYELKSRNKESDLIFPMSSKNEIMTRSAISNKLVYCLRIINKLYAKDQLDTQKGVSDNLETKEIDFTFHLLRHTYVCFLHKAGIDLKEAQYLTGHKDLKVLLEIYTHLDAEDHKNATEKLNNFINV